jgi:Fe2+ or Zn2+ uptake regulation protein
MPASGTAFSLSWSFALRIETPIAPALMTPVAAAVPALRKPSGACMASPEEALLLRIYRSCDSFAKASYDGGMAVDATELTGVLRDAGYRVTGPRRLVWDVLSTTHHHLTVEEIAERARSSDPAINRSSVYRSLDLFSELGIARESNLGPGSASHWELAHPDDQFHLRCTVCGRVEHHTGDLVARISSHLADHHDFAAEHVQLVVAGRCSDCTGR